MKAGPLSILKFIYESPIPFFFSMSGNCTIISWEKLYSNLNDSISRIDTFLLAHVWLPEESYQESIPFLIVHV
jgi:hypothetical protein